MSLRVSRVCKRGYCLATVSHMWSSGGGEAKRSEILFMASVYTILVLFLSLHPVGAWHAWRLHAEHKHVTCII